MRKLVLPFALSLLLSSTLAIAQPNPFSVIHFPSTTITATSFTSPAIDLARGTNVGNSFATGIITLTGTSLTTATFGVLGSFDGGATYFPINIYPVLTPTTGGTTATATANGVYTTNLSGVDHVKFVTSGTFTATNIKLDLTGSPNAIISRNTGGGGGGGCTSAGPLGTVQASDGAGGCQTTGILDNGSLVAISRPATIAGGSSHGLTFGSYAAAPIYGMISFNGSLGADFNDVAIVAGGASDGSLFFDTGSGGNFTIRNGTGSAYATVLSIAGTGAMTTSGGVLPSIDPAATAGQATCVKSNGPPLIIGKCTSVVGVGGACTCA